MKRQWASGVTLQRRTKTVGDHLKYIQRVFNTTHSWFSGTERLTLLVHDMWVYSMSKNPFIPLLRTGSEASLPSASSRRYPVSKLLVDIPCQSGAFVDMIGSNSVPHQRHTHPIPSHPIHPTPTFSASLNTHLAFSPAGRIHDHGLTVSSFLVTMDHFHPRDCHA